MSASTTTAPRFDKLKIGGWAAFEVNMVAFLRARGLMGHVTGSLSPLTVPALTDRNPDTVAFLQSKLDNYNVAKERAAGEIMLMLEPDEQDVVCDLSDSPKQLWDALKKRHVQERPTARYNAYDDFFNIRLKEGETLSHVATRVKAGMRLIKERRPSKFTMEDLDNELVVIRAGRYGRHPCAVWRRELPHTRHCAHALVGPLQGRRPRGQARH